MRSLDGSACKLVDKAGKRIGVLFLPKAIAEQIEKRDVVRVFRRPHQSISCFPTSILDSVMVQTFLVCQSYHSGDVVELVGIEPEEVENEPGFAFLPNAEYMRRPVRVEVVEPRREEPPGPFLQAAREVG